MRLLPRALSACVALFLFGGSQATASPTDASYWLVFVNGRNSHALVEFIPVQGHIHARRSELNNVGLEPGDGAPDELVALETLIGASYIINEADQSIRFEAGASALATRQISGATDVGIAPTPIDPGFVLNYDALLSSGDPAQGSLAGLRRPQGSLALDARAFSPWGEVSSTAIVGATQFSEANFLRLDTAYEYRDRERLLTARAGDTISGGFGWTRPIRIGGVQLRREFGLRSDLVTTALPTIRGTAAVPTPVDVFVNNVHAYSTEVGEGPFQINQIPMLTGAGQATIVTRDVSGREVRQDLPFFSSAQLLRGGLYEYSLEAGLPRIDYGLNSDSYVRDPVAIGSGRFGVSDKITVEGHVESTSGFASGGLGVNLAVGGYGVITAAASGSRDGGRTGLQYFGAAEVRWRSWSFNVSSQRADERFSDLAAITARSFDRAPNGTASGMGGVAQLVSTRPMRALDRVAVSTPIEALGGTASLSFVRQSRDDGAHNRLVLASFSRSWSERDERVSIWLRRPRREKEFRLFIGFSKRLGDANTSASARSVNRRTQFAQEASRPLSPEPGSYGWRVAATEGSQPVKDASAAYRTSVARVEARVEQGFVGSRAEVEIDGAVGIIGGTPFASNRVRDSFALVRTGASDVAVLSENRFAGRTGWGGTLVVPDLRAFERNKIEMDMASFPENYAPGQTEAHIVPAGRGGVLVDFSKTSKAAGVLLVLVDARGKPLPIGSYGQAASGEDVIVGYGGEAFLNDPENAETLAINIERGAMCKVAIDLQTILAGKSRPLTCQ